MATGKKVEAVVQVVQPAKVVLELTQEEATVLKMILGSIGGDPATTRRGLLDGISKALTAAGVHAPALEEPVWDYVGNMIFVRTADTYRGIRRKHPVDQAIKV